MKGRNGVPDRWLDYSSVGKRLEGTRFIAFKVPLKQDLTRHLCSTEVFSHWELLDAVRQQNQEVGLIIDLTNTARYYTLEDVPDSLLVVKILTAGHHVPSDATILSFKRTVRKFLQDNQDNETLIGVHCTHGLNRTGYLICRYLIDVDGMDPDEALQLFNSSRGHDIERQNYIADLRGGPKRSNQMLDVDQAGLEPQRGEAAHRPEDSSAERDWRDWRGPPPPSRRGPPPPSRDHRSSSPHRPAYRRHHDDRHDPPSHPPPSFYSPAHPRTPPRPEWNRYPPPDRDRHQYPPQDRDRFRYPPQDRDRQQYPPQDRDRFRYPPQDRDRQQYPPQDRDRFRYPPQGGSRYQDPPQGRGRYQDPPQGGGRYQDPPQGGGRYQDPPQGRGRYQDPPQGGGRYQDPPQGGGRYRYPPPEPGWSPACRTQQHRRGAAGPPPPPLPRYTPRWATGHDGGAAD